MKALVGTSPGTVKLRKGSLTALKSSSAVPRLELRLRGREESQWSRRRQHIVPGHEMSGRIFGCCFAQVLHKRDEEEVSVIGATNNESDTAEN